MVSMSCGLKTSTGKVIQWGCGSVSADTNWHDFERRQTEDTDDPQPSHTIEYLFSIVDRNVGQVYLKCLVLCLAWNRTAIHANSFDSCVC